MILWELFLGFLRVGCFAFGGAYSAIPLIREIVLSYGWLTEDALAGMIAISESTPGPIMVNLATYVGMEQAGVPGAVVATFAVVMPSFVIILLVMAAFRTLVKHPLFQSMLAFMKPCIAGIILAAGAYMMLKSCFLVDNGWQVDLRTVTDHRLSRWFDFSPSRAILWFRLKAGSNKPHGTCLPLKRGSLPYPSIRSLSSCSAMYLLITSSFTLPTVST